MLFTDLLIISDRKDSSDGLTQEKTWLVPDWGCYRVWASIQGTLGPWGSDFCSQPFSGQCCLKVLMCPPASSTPLRKGKVAAGAFTPGLMKDSSCAHCYGTNLKHAVWPAWVRLCWAGVRGQCHPNVSLQPQKIGSGCWADNPRDLFLPIFLWPKANTAWNRWILRKHLPVLPVGIQRF